MKKKLYTFANCKCVVIIVSQFFKCNVLLKGPPHPIINRLYLVKGLLNDVFTCFSGWGMHECGIASKVLKNWKAASTGVSTSLG